MDDLTVTAKTCRRCKQVKSAGEFGRSASTMDGLRRWCKTCEVAASLGWQAKNREHRQGYKRKLHEKNRSRAFDHYGWACQCCGSTERLTIDHINGDGIARRKELGRSSTKMYRWIIRTGFPDDLQTLCDPCNQSKRHGPQCRLDHEAASVAPRSPGADGTPRPASTQA